MSSHLQVVSDPETVSPFRAGGAPLTVERVVETEADGTERHEVRVTLSRNEMRTILHHIARLVHDTRSAHLVRLAGRPAGRGEVLDRALEVEYLMQRLLLPQHTITLGPAEADDLSIDLDEASQDPARCDCGRLVQQPTQLTTTCGWCVERLGGDR